MAAAAILAVAMRAAAMAAYRQVQGVTAALRQ
jgi:hypothetical protein